MYKKFLILVKLNIIYGTEKFLINLDFDYNFTLSGLIPYIANIIGVGKDAGDNLILLDSNKEILSPNCKIIELIIMCPNKYNSITVKLNKSYKTKTFESKGLSQCISSNYLQRTNENTLRNENYYENKKYFEPNSNEIDISEINYDKISPSYSEIISNINNTHSLGNNMHIDGVRERDKREKSPCNETNKTNRKSRTYSSDGFSYYKSKYNYPQSDLYSDLSEKILDKNKIYKKNEGQEFATFAENMDENVKLSNLKIYNNKFDIEKNNYDYSKNYFYDKKDHTEERRLKTQIKVKNNYSSKTKNKIEEYNSFEENNDYEAFPQDDPSNKYNYSPVSREKLTLEDNEFPNKSKVASEKRNFRDREEIRIVNSVNEINNKPRRLIEDKKHSREQEIMDIRERYEKKMKNNEQLKDVYNLPYSYSGKEKHVINDDSVDNENRFYTNQEKKRIPDRDRNLHSSREKIIYSNNTNKQSKSKLYNSTASSTGQSMAKSHRNFYEDKVQSKMSGDNKNYEKRH